MPSLGADMEQGVLIEWLVKVGDHVRRGDVVAVVETPKSTVEVECFETGTVTRLLAEEGQTVPVGEALALLGAATEVEATVAAPATVEATAAAPVTVPVAAGAGVAAGAPAPSGAASGSTARPPLSPVLRHLARELGVDPTTLHGTGRDGALTRHDVEQAAVAPTPATTSPHRPRVSPLARRLAAEEGVDLTSVQGTGPDGSVRAEDVRRATRHTGSGERAASAPTSRVEVKPEAAPEEPPPPPMSDMRRSIAALMTVSNQEIPHYHLSLTIDLWRSLQWMKERNRELEMSERLVPAALLLAATARAARAVPELNGHWIEGAFRPAADVDLGLILSLRSGGLLVPAIGGADRLSVDEMMARIKVLTRRARSGRLRGSDLVPPSITVSNLGDQGVDSVLGVIYPPQVALVGFGAVAERPWAVDGMLGVRPLVTITLAGDHRATDGATGSRLLKTIDRLLQAPEEL
ncbi:pyruvate dehydrogenase E2 component (dihydrolipoamide acetyltransferase) [Humibacillus xanthopallidus]|uniref:Dihydrolipoamide acetyltransferase component of pyruvate dehydrogenase complex n=2 Tax=Humibacillus xanthopallidus TaxID=412689 RepID=A0A543HGG7_9MICO|nr:pyruvate dehydrogenase E2 component (dihydrolipoamide acetyltransferase) [Humibacillus xanthopallidus]